MTIGLLQMAFLIPGAHSLKDKRRVIKSVKQKLQNRYNISIAEVGEKEQWGRAQLAVCVVGDDSRFVNTQLNEVVAWCERHADAQLIDVSIERM